MMKFKMYVTNMRLIQVEFSSDGARIVLKVGALYKNVDEFRKVVKVFPIQNGVRLKRVKK